MASFLYGAPSHGFIGTFATDAEALAVVQACKWDSLGTGFGTPQAGMTYFDTTYQLIKTYTGTAWWSGLKTYMLGRWSMPTTTTNTTVLPTWNFGSWVLALPPKSQWDFLRYSYYFALNFVNVSGVGNAGNAKLMWYDHATAAWTALDSSLITGLAAPFYRLIWSGILDLTTVTEADDLWWTVALANDAAGSFVVAGAAIFGVPKV